jgi:hypothetical protein
VSDPEAGEPRAYALCVRPIDDEAGREVRRHIDAQIDQALGEVEGGPDAPPRRAGDCNACGPRPGYPCCDAFDGKDLNCWARKEMRPGTDRGIGRAFKRGGRLLQRDRPPSDSWSLC